MSNALHGRRTSASLGDKAAIFRRGEGGVSAFSSPAFVPLRSPLPPRPALLKANRKSREVEETPLSPIPTVLPELVSPSDSALVSDCLLPWTKSSAIQVIKVYSEDNTSRVIEVPSDITARDICQLFILKNHCVDDHSWTLFEQLAHLGIERTIEDHESVMEVQSGWDVYADSRLYFRKNYAKYEFFKKPLDFFPDHMVSISSETNGMMNHSQLIQTFLSLSTCPEIHGHLHAKEQGRKCWKKFYFVLRRSGLYFSNKGASKEPRHLQFIAEFSDSDVYTLLSARKTHGAPTDYGFCIKPNKSSSPRDLKLLCADEEHVRTCWVTAIRLFKYGMQLYQNFIQPHQKQRASPMRSISENSLVAMDFSGNKTRVIENPSEALSVAVEEGLSWRRKSCHRLSSHGSPSTSQSPMSNLAIHRAQPWFHSKLSREEAHRLITEQGLIDGVFLLRDSQSNPKTFVLSLCHAQRIKHFQILPVEDEGELFFSLDDGHTRFTDLIQLVEFYQLNRGVLPCRLKHHCARIAL
ncbi:growth factor receptor-bound protein 14 isoform X1 [Megalops cyprinoides]|uniref:growth factor receptor-bound protein 14 isoform X1 n=1 Tax=Megalops cyprinoides TaxID=118141 RepID=UPI001863F7E6|nr:growth factor receptor-bound protein 14 isoform X1 [Megalops cyprinoides]XP_036401300.1 growth factor receptor-bound protein 14 isoform X1 [Megalops cyprinoides]